MLPITRTLGFFFGLPLIFTVVASAQEQLEVFAGMQYQSSLSQRIGENSLEQYWNPSLNGGLRLNVHLAESITLGTAMSINHYFYHASDQNTSARDTGRVYTILSGDPAAVVRATVVVRMTDHSDSFVNPYAELGGGYIYEHTGALYGRVDYVKFIRYEKDVQPTSRAYVACLAGGGGKLVLGSAVSIDISIHIYSNTSDRSYFVFGAGIEYGV